MNYQDLIKQIKAGDVKPAYFFYGAERMLLNRAKKLIEQALNGSVEIRSLKLSVARTIEMCDQKSIFREKKMIYLEDFEKMDEDEAALLITYLKKPCLDTTVIFTPDKIDSRRKIDKALMSVCQTAEFTYLDRAKRLVWAQNYLKANNAKYEAGAVECLLDRITDDLYRLSNELNKLISFAGEGTIYIKAVKHLVIDSREADSFELWDALLDEDVKRCLQLADKLCEVNDPLQILGMVAALYRKILGTKIAIEQKMDFSVMRNKFKLFGPSGSKIINYAKRKSKDDLTSNTGLVAQADSLLKSGASRNQIFFQMLILQLLCKRK